MQNLGPSLATLVIVIAFARLVGFLFRKLGQPPVMGEVLGGILLGPSVIGYFFPASSAFLFHGESLDFLKHIAEVGICLYLFVMGLEIDLPRLRKTARSAILISQMSIVLPFGLGLLLAQQLYSNYAPAGFGILEFSLFIGVALSIAAFPVLARILANSSLHKTRLGDLALTCAAIDDIIAWRLLTILRPILAKAISSLEKKIDRLPEALLAFAILGALTSAVITDVIGIHALFGAFLFGVIIPHESQIAKEVTGRLQDFIRILFLPAFFALTGMKTQISLISSPSDWLIYAIIIAVAILGKFGGAYLGATLSGNTRREATILGVLMNTRGLVELIVLNIGLSLGILTPTLFTMLVLMALVTTFMAGPLLRLAGPYSEKSVTRQGGIMFVQLATLVLAISFSTVVASAHEAGHGSGDSADHSMPPKNPESQAMKPPSPNASGEYGEVKFDASKATAVSAAAAEGNALVKATVAEVCPKKGCWMSVNGAKPGEKVRVTFKDYGFFVPTELVGKEVALQGQYVKHVESVEEQKHLLKDAKRPQAEIDAITKPKETLRFIAIGVKDLSLKPK